MAQLELNPHDLNYALTKAVLEAVKFSLILLACAHSASIKLLLSSTLLGCAYFCYSVLSLCMKLLSFAWSASVKLVLLLHSA